MLASPSLLSILPLLLGAVQADRFRPLAQNAGQPLASSLGSLASTAIPPLLLPDPYIVSQTLGNITSPQKSQRNISELFTYWGEFIAQDVSHIQRPNRGAAGASANITLPAVAAAGAANASTTPSFQFGVPQSNAATPPLPINFQTSFVDASHIYGTSATPAFGPGGKFAMTGQGLPLYNRFANATDPLTTALPGIDATALFSFPSINGNTSPAIQSLYIIFMREHNRYIDTLVAAGQGQDDAIMFQLGRQHIVALIQQIHYYDYLPLLLGENLLASPAPAYSASVNPSVDILYEAAAFRYGHMEVTSSQTIYTDSGKNPLPIMDVFWKTQTVAENGVFPVLAGLAQSVQLQPMLYMIPELRNSLFGNRPMDLFAIDIQRGRSFGLPTFNAVRKAYGMTTIPDFASLTNDTGVATALGQLYTTIDQLDVIVGGLAEATGASSNVGPLFQKIIVDQFLRLRDGDPFWFESPGVLTAAHLNEIRHTSLRDVIARNVPEVSSDVAQARLLKNPFQAIEARTVSAVSGFSFNRPHIEGQYMLSWTIESPDALLVNVRCASEGWCGLGFGTDMTVAQFVIGHLDQATQKVMVEARSTSGGWNTPVVAASQAGLEIIATDFSDKTISFQFRRTRPAGAPAFTDTQDLIMAMNPLATTGAWFGYHGANREKVPQMSFVTGTSAVADNVTARRVMHGIGQAIVWLFVFPFGVVWGRYLRFVTGWMAVHAFLQSIGSIAVICLIVLPLSDPQNMGLSQNSPHSYIGLALLALVVVQITLGLLNRQRLHSQPSKRHNVRMAHSVIGVTMLLGGFANVGFGLKRLYPAGFTLTAPWVAYLAVIAFWISLFVAMEAYRRFTNRSFNQSTVPVQVIKVSHDKKVVKMTSGITPKMPALTRRPTGPENVETPPRMYTWDGIADAVLNGEHLVVGNGQYVYNIKPWLAHHPGGKIILETVNGTDITLDFFNESDYDGALIGDAVKAATRNAATLARGPPAPSAMSVHEKQHATYSTLNVDEDDEAGAALTVDLSAPEWDAVRKARWSHAHSKLAAQKLIGFMVGEISTKTSHQQFNCEELRRYAMVDKTCLSGPDATCPIYLFKFSLLYPFEGRRENEPSRFLPGQHMVFVDRVSNKPIARSYTPISGSPSSFEIMVKLYPEGRMSKQLLRTKPGLKQYRIRGPFGQPIVSVPKALASDSVVELRAGRLGQLDNYYEALFCIVAGSGVVSALQFVREYLLPAGKTLTAHTGYQPAQDDELPVTVGDRIKLLTVGTDGWSIGVNVETEEEGLVPLSILEPPAGQSSKIVIVNCVSTIDECASIKTLEAASLSFPANLEIHHFVSNGVSVGAFAGVGTAHSGRLTHEGVEGIVYNAWETGHDESRKVIVCGPAGFEGTVYDALIDLGLEQDEIVILPPAEVDA
ncbi:hypothetical protein HDU87_001501 [Geranomyces variabilis]|uniref:Peroxidase n=1 Tax=Geranomyces variabilis TaxID=109894 RepID=A0AAD5TGP8_9FUNG|nr:hypothetical protein HDU87_001501 [Geranomyces variabilis]